MSELPTWAKDVVRDFESETAGCFVLHGNVGDPLLIPTQAGEAARLGSMREYLEEVLLPRFEVLVSYDLGEGLRVWRGEKIFDDWAKNKEQPSLPLPALRFVGEFLRYLRNTRNLGGKESRVAVVVQEAQLVCPAAANGGNYEENALASLLRSWASDGLLQTHHQAVFLLADRVANLHSLLVREPRIPNLELTLPDEMILKEAFHVLEPQIGDVLSAFKGRYEELAMAFRGASLSSVETLLRRLHYEKKVLKDEDAARLKRELVEKECEGLIEFVEPDRSLAKVIGLESVKQWLQDDLALWRQGELEAMPMGYLFCGPVGTGKTYLAECLAGEAGVPMVTIRNFRDKWVGSTEANLEKIFALLHALGRCLVMIDEADQALGKRQGGSGDGGVSSRVYSMMAAEMSDTRNRGKILWVLASSRPDLIEVDLKRPGRIDVKIPLFPSVEPEESFTLLRALCRARGCEIEKAAYGELQELIPDMLTPGAAEAIAVKAYRQVKARGETPLEALKGVLTGYLPPIDPEILRHQMKLAADENTEPAFLSGRVKAVLGNDL